tara:strand:+ start:855 stop:1580 length:726 start_codon:yes stop_codon:yes gene_type:complete
MHSKPNMEIILNELKNIRNEIGSLVKLFYIKKGSNCSKSGKKYENEVYTIIKNSPFVIGQGGGSSHAPDINCVDDKSIEVKKASAPDWGQTVLKWKNDSWFSKSELFNKYLNKLNMKHPPFLQNNMIYEEWLKIKSEYKDEYIDIDDNAINEYYRKKGTYYIQLSDGYGLYHLGDDVFNLGVPKFEIKQRMRVRVKVHSRSNNNGYAQLSVTGALQPINLNQLMKSPYSLDNMDKLPPNLL